MANYYTIDQKYKKIIAEQNVCGDKIYYKTALVNSYWNLGYKSVILTL